MNRKAKLTKLQQKANQLENPFYFGKEPDEMGGEELQAAARQIRIDRGEDPDVDPFPHLSFKQKLDMSHELRRQRHALMREMGFDPYKR